MGLSIRLQISLIGHHTRVTGSIIVPDKKLIKVGRRKHTMIPMYIAEMQGGQIGHRAKRSTQDIHRSCLELKLISFLALAPLLLYIVF